ncbi:MAG: tetratricopeptide repeat protein [Phycisphaerae bacterium]|jgi:tetratricopeptide (TPR) repeat protein|nr:tetratricopeptide repeat protein [Phycisphaerae bacterium]
MVLRRRPWLGFLGVWFFAILAPSSSIMPLLIQPAAEKRLYLPLAAVIVAVVAGAYVLGRRLVYWLKFPKNRRKIVGRFVGCALAAGVVVALGVVTVRRNCDYRSNLAIWDDTVGKQRYNWRARNNRGLAYSNRGDHAAAIRDYSKAIDLNPVFALAYSNRAAAYYTIRRYEQAWADVEACRKLGGGNQTPVYYRPS